MTKTIKIMLTGKDGQLGKALVERIPASIKLVALGRQELDLSDKQACHNAVLEHRPDWIINAGAYTAVDRAESEPELALAVNAAAPGALAQALDKVGGRLLQISTDFVFNGSQAHPYHPDQPVDPISVYGATKAEGERLVQKALPPTHYCILRTSWVYGPVGNNFCLTMLRLHRLKSAENQTLNVVADQIGCPTSTFNLANACWSAINLGTNGIHHFCDAGAASWYDFAIAIGNAGVAAGIIDQSANVIPITTSEYPTPAKRPGYSLLDCTDTRNVLELEPNHWQKELAIVMSQIPK
ncbi:MAG: dTDP-4-dehydrorhamnose reductase [Cyanobacteria bacterium]|nr:dTDP-4-dehydrorhamnose reductase [Cyanobacteriota bacterium]